MTLERGARNHSAVLVAIATVATGTGIFIFDMLMPLGVAAGIPYVGLVLFSLFSPKRQYAVYLASISTVLIVVGYFLSAPLGILWIAIINRLLAVSVVWATAELCRRHQRTIGIVAENASKFKRWMKDSFVGVLKSNAKGEILEANDAFLAMIGYSREELQAGSIDWKKMTPPEFLCLDERALKEVGQRGSCTPYEKQYFRKDGTRISIIIGFSQIDDLSNEFLVFVVNISELKQVEEKLQESERKSLAWLENSPVCTKVLDLDFNLQFMSSAGVKALGISDVEKIIGKPYPLDFYPESFRKPMIENLGKAKENGEIVVQEAPVNDLDGNELWFHSTIIPVNDDKGLLDYILILSLEITDRKKAEEALKESEKKYRTLFEQSADAILIIEGEQFVDCNLATVKMLGYKNKKELLETHPSQLSPETQPDGKSSFVKANKMMAIALERGSHRFEWDHKRQNGQVFPVEVLLTAVPFPDKKFLHVVWRDITERKRLEELEFRAARLETAGTIAGQVAHDFNNLLAPLMAYPEFIRESLPADHRAARYLLQMEKAAQKIADINQQLLTLGRRGHYTQSVLNLNTIIEQALEELPSLGQAISCTRDLAPDLMNITGGASQLHRVITNLLLNALDALPGEGQITVKTENFSANEVSGAYGLVPRGEYVKLTLSDTGCGIPDELVQKILDPFFTTKNTDKKRGSGLGLSVIDTVVKDHHGYLDLETKPGKGTSFYIYFPITHKPAVEDHADEIQGGTETILVVDDDDIQRDVSTQLLERLGYKIKSVSSGEKAVELLGETPFDLLILDMVMPGGIDGTETYRRILKISPAQKAIIVSGFSETDRAQAALALGAGAFVKKPLTKKVIAAAVRSELDRKRDKVSV